MTPTNLEAENRFIQYYLSEFLERMDEGPESVQDIITNGERPNFLRALDLAKKRLGWKPGEEGADGT